MEETFEMTSEHDKKFILAIETSVGGGSVSILNETDEVDFVLGGSEKLKSAAILDDINDLLTKNNLNKKRLGLIAVSGGPGSLTGVRVGIALAKGLSDALRIPSRIISVLEALRLENETSETVLTAVYVGRNEIAYKKFFGRPKQISPITSTETVVCDIYEFEKKAQKDSETESFGIIITDEIYRKFSETERLEAMKVSGRIKSARKNLAELIGRAARNDWSHQV